MADEVEGCCCGGDVCAVNVCLQADEGGLEDWSDADTSDDLVHDDAGPGGVGLQVDEETVAESHEDEAGEDEFAVAACDFDDCTCGDGGERERETEGEDVDAGEDWGGLEDGLEVEREVVVSGDEGEGVAEVDGQDEDVVPVVEETEGDDRVFGELPFVQHGEDPGYHAKDD